MEFRKSVSIIKEALSEYLQIHVSIANCDERVDITKLCSLASSLPGTQRGNRNKMRNKKGERSLACVTFAEKWL